MRSHLRLHKAFVSARSMVEKSLYMRRICSVADLCLPDFLGIGAQKAGTTWLYENLRCHPDLYLPDKKELHYFDCKFHQTLRSYSDKFKPGAHKRKGEITPAYGILAINRIQFIRRIMPDVRLILLLRNPVERAWSQAVMNLVTQPNRRIEDVHENEFYAHFTSAPSMRRGCYSRIVDNWLSVFPHEQLFVGFFADIPYRPKELLSNVFQHLSVSCDVDWNRFPYNQVVRPHTAKVAGTKSSGPELPKKYGDFLRKLYRSEIESLHERFGSAVADWRSQAA